MRLRHPRGASLEALIVNTGGGIVAGDFLSIDITLEASARVIVSSVAAEKVYRSEGAASTIVTKLDVGAGAWLVWLPQETILFDQARLGRRFIVDLAADATFVACELVQFGRLASGEHATTGLLSESWRVRRDGRLLHADESRIDGTIGASLDRRALGAGARAAATFLFVAPDSAEHGASLEAVLAPFRSTDPTLEGGVTVKDGIVLARLLARSTSNLRPCVEALLAALPGLSLPRSWH